MGMDYGLIESLEARRHLSVGTPDPTFGDDGAVRIAVAPGSSVGAMDTLADGRFVVARTASDAADGTILHVSRFLPGGEPDATFGGTNGQPAGTVRIALPFRLNLYDLESDASGKLLLGGGGGQMTLVRLNENGTIDTSFGGTARGMPAGTPAGVSVVSFDGLELERITDLAVAPDGRIGAAGTSGYDTTQSGLMAGFNPDGSIIPALTKIWKFPFYDSAQFSGSYGAGTAAAFTPDGGFLVGGYEGHYGLFLTGQRASSLTKYDASGEHLWAWRGEDAFTYEQDDMIGALAVDGGMILAGGAVDRSHTLARFNGDGTLYLGFGVGGITMSPFEGWTGSIRSIQVLPDGRFYAVGDSRGLLEGFDVSLARYTVDGQPDPVFPAGTIAAQSGGEPGLRLIGDDALVLHVESGSVDLGISGAFTVRRFEGDGARLTRNGTLLIGGTSGDDTINITRRFRDGRILVETNGQGQLFLPQLVKRIQVYGFGGHDVVTVGPNVRSAYLNGGDGNDTLTGGDGDDLLVGGDGNDSLTGALGNDSLEGGVGNDGLHGNAGDDYLLGSAGRDVIHGHGGRDQLIGAGGNDQLFGGPGSADNVSGGPGFDQAANDPLDTYAGVEQLL
jgi:uncharacterized delta-60 repeat protein